jgi:hypothetical protein
MALRRLSAICALIFGVFLGYVAVRQAFVFPFGVWAIERALVAAIALAAGMLTLRGARIRYLSLAMLLALAWQWPSLVFGLVALSDPSWHFSWPGLWSTSFIVLPMAALFASFLADGRLKAAAAFIRNLPHEEGV